MVEVVFQVKFVEVEGHNELCEIGREVLCSHQGEGEVWPVIGVSDCGGGGGRWYWVRYAQEDLLAPECNHRGGRRGRDS